MKRRADVAKACGVEISAVQEVDRATVQRALADRVSAMVLEVATQEPATYWRVGDRYFFDDPYFGEIVEFTEFDYNSTIGLHRRRA